LFSFTFSLLCFNLFQNTSENSVHILSITYLSVEVIVAAVAAAAAVFCSSISSIKNISSSSISSVQILVIITEKAVLMELCGMACW